MHFQLRYVTPNFQFGSTTVSIVEPKSGISLSFSKRAKEDGTDYQPNDGLAVIVCQRDIPERHQQVAVNSGQLSIKKQSVRAVNDEMNGFFLRTLRLLRWRTNPVNTDSRLVRYSRGFYWSLDGNDWKSVLDLYSAKIVFKRMPQWNSQVEEFLIDGLGASQDEPLSHDLLREAEALKDDNLRGSLVLAVAAAEVGFKQFVTTHLPQTAWLLDLPSPPLEKLLDSFPWADLNLQINQTGVKFPEPLKHGLKKAVHLRNVLVHTGVMHATTSTIEEMLTCVGNMLYFLDALSGQKWAMGLIDSAVLREFQKT